MPPPDTRPVTTGGFAGVPPRRGPALVLLLFCLGVIAGPAADVRLTVAEPAGVDRQQWPVTSGIPLAQGAVRDDQATVLLDAAGREIPVQSETLARWPDGSVRWLLLDCQIDLAARETKTFTLRYGAAVQRAAVEKPVRVAPRSDGTVAIDTGPLKLEYDPKHFLPQGRAWLTALGPAEDQRDTPGARAEGVSLINDHGQVFSAGGEKTEITVEQAGPLRACLRVSGWHEAGGKRLFRYVARVHAWRGQPYVRVFYTFLNDDQDSLMARITGLNVGFVTGGAPGDCILDGKPVTHGRLFQVDESHFSLDEKAAGGRGRGWAAAGSDRLGLAVGLREFWQNWPKAIRCEAGRITLELCPELPQGLYDGRPLEEENKLYYALRGGRYTFKVGVAKTHEFWVNYFAGPPDARRLEPFFQAAEDPLLATAEADHVGATKALGDFPPADPRKYAGYDAWFSAVMDEHLRLRDRVREYGLLNYGDWFGERKVNWGNLEYDFGHGMLVQFLRTGDRRYFLRGEQAARHHTDVDVVHATNPALKNPWGPPPQVGEVWLHALNHTGGYYENAPLPVDRTYQMGHSTNFGHVWAGGDFEYYFLTGDRRVREVAVAVADAMARNCPTSYGTHIRNLGWPVLLLINAHEATGDRKYLAAATLEWEVLRKNLDDPKGWVVRLAGDHCGHGDRRCYGNVPFMEGLTVSALARYHRATGNPEVLRAMSVAIDQMIRECWLEDSKVFRYTACPLTGRSPDALPLAAEGMAYEAALTGNPEHRRVLREGLGALFRRPASGHGKSLGQVIHFTPFALRALEPE